MRANSMRGLLGITAILTAVLQASAIESKSTQRDYQTIVERNPFGLKPPPPPPAAPTNEAPKVDFYLTGITSLGGPRNRKRAYLMSKDAKKPEYYSLTEGQSKDGLEILQIDAKQRTVKIRNNGIEKLMSFENDRIPEAKAAAPAPGARPGQPGAAVPLPNAPGQPNGNNAANHFQLGAMNNVNPGSRKIPSRLLRTQPPPTYGGLSGAFPPANPVANANYPQQPNMNAEEQRELMLRQQQQVRQSYGLPPANPGTPAVVYPPIPPP